MKLLKKTIIHHPSIIRYSLFVIQLLLKPILRPAYWLHKLLRKNKYFRKLPQLTQEIVSIVMVFVIIFTGTGLVYIFGPWNKNTEAAWFNDNWAYRKRIDVTVTSSSSDITSLDTLITIDTTGITSKIQSGCQDFRFTNINGDQLPYYVDTCNNNSATATKIWVRLDKVPKNTTTYTMYFYYGNPSATSQSDATTFRLYNGLTGYWTMNESSWSVSTACPGGTNSVTDSSVNGNNAQACPQTTGPTGGATGKYGNAGLFDGTNDYINLPNSSTLKSADGTFAAWVKTSTDNDIDLLGVSNSGGTTVFSIELGTNASAACTNEIISVMTGTNAGTNLCYTSATRTELFDGNWHHIVVTVDSSTHIYLDGVSKTVTTGVGADSGTFTETSTFNLFRIGNLNYNSSDVNHFNGNIDDARIYNRALSADEVSQLYSNPGSITTTATATSQPTTSFATEEKAPSPTLYWKLDEGFGTTTHDSTINNLNGSPSGVLYKKGSFQRSGCAATCSQSITGVGFQPKAIILFSDKQTSEGFAQDLTFSFGASTGSSQSASSSWGSVDAGASSDAGRRRSITDVLTLFSAGSPTNSARASLTSFDSDGFTLSWTFTNDSNQDIIHYVAIGGSEIVSAKVGQITIATSGASQAFTDPGFQPDFLMLFGTLGETVDTNTTHAKFSLGYGTDSSHQGVTSISSTDNLNTMDTRRYQSTSEIWASFINNSNTIDTQAALSSMDTNGFTLNVTNLPTSSLTVNYLAIKGGNHKVGTITQPSSTGLQTTSGFGFQPQGLLMSSFNRSAFSGATTNAQIALGAASSSLNQGDLWVADVHNLADAQTAMSTVTTSAIRIATADSTVNGEASLSSFDTGGFTLNWTTADTLGTEVLFWAVGTTSTLSWKPEDLCVSSGCLLFNGSSDKLSLTDSDKLDFTASDNFTVEAWIKHTGAIATNPDYILTKADGTNGGYKVYMDSSGNLCFGIDDDSSFTPDDSACSSGTRYDDNKWHHIAGVKAGTSAIRIYVDGLKAGEDTSIAATGTLANSGSLYVGIDSDGSSNSWAGFLDEVKIYRDNSERSAAQIKADFIGSGNPKGASAVLGANTQNMPGALSNGLVGYWKMDESSWTIDCSTTSVTDSSGNSNNAKSCPTSTGPTVATGKFGNAGSFDGGGSDHVLIPAATSLNNASFSAGGWFKPSALAVSGLIEKNDATLSWRLFMHNTSGGIEFDGVNDTINLQSTSNVATGNWYHIFVTFDSTTKKMAIYINGALNTSQTASGDLGGTQNLDIKIGNGFSGSIDETRIYNRALSSSEVSQLYNWAPGPSIYLKMDETTGQTAYDSSGNGKNATLDSTTKTPTWKIGKFGNGLNFDGTDDNATISSPSLPTGDFTYSLWAMETGNDDVILNIADGAANTKEFKLHDNATSHLEVTLNGSGTPEITTTSTVSTNAWHHIAITRSGSTIKAYIDGVQDVTTGSNSTPLGFGSCPLVIGAANSDAAQCSTSSTYSAFWTGKLDELKVYNYARTQGQIIEDMNGGHPAPGSPVGSPVLHYKFDTGYGSGTGVIKNSGNCLSTCDADTTGTVTWTNSGKFSKAVTLSSNGYVRMSSDPTALKITGTITLSAWIKGKAAGGGTQVILGKSGTNAGTSLGYRLYLDNSSKLNMDISSDGTSANTKTATGNTALTSTSTWYHVVGVFNPSNSITVYVNSIQDGQNTTSIPSAIFNNSILFSVGADNYTIVQNAPANFFNGTIDEAKIFSSALTADQIKVDMNRGQAQRLGNQGDNSNYSSGAATQEYCVPGDTSTCDAPVGRWDLDEGSGTTAIDTSGNGNYSASNISAGTGGYVRGKVNKAYNFDGANTVINVGSGSTIDDITTQTFEAWIYPRTLGESAGANNFIGRIYEKGDGTEARLIYLDSTGSTSTSPAFLTYQQQPGGTWATLDGTIPFNTWTHVAITYDNSVLTNAAKIYLNGVLVSMQLVTNQSGTATSDAAGSARIGNRQGLDRTFDGYIDQVRIFNYIRTPAQIAWDYNRGAPAAWWKLDECQGTTINDSSGNSNSATLTVTTTSVGTCSTSSTTWGNGATGKRNYSVSFDGTDDVIQAAETTYTDLGGLDTSPTPDIPLHSYSLAAWVKTSTNFSTDAYILAKDDGTGAYPYKLYLNSSEQACFQISDGTNSPSICGSTALNDNNWHLVVGMRDLATDQLKLYVDGSSAASAVTDSTTATTSLANNDNVSIGNGGTSYTAFDFNGQIDDARIYSYALTPTQVKLLMNEGAARFGPSTGAP